MRAVVLIAGDDTVAGVAFAKTAARDCLAKGDMPISLQLMNLVGFSAAEVASVAAALDAWHAKADAAVVYTDQGVSAKMQDQIDAATAQGKTVETRSTATAKSA